MLDFGKLPVRGNRQVYIAIDSSNYRYRILRTKNCKHSGGCQILYTLTVKDLKQLDLGDITTSTHLTESEAFETALAFHNYYNN